jgi:hypothetical protein
VIRIRDRRNFACGALFVAIGCGLAWSASRMTIGTASAMGPGWFPMALGVLLGVLGAAIAIQSLLVDGAPAPGSFEWRGFVLVTFAILTFAATITRLGFVPAVALTTLIATLASRRMRVRTAVILVLVLLAFCWLVFVRGLGLPVRMFGS